MYHGVPEKYTLCKNKTNKAFSNPKKLTHHVQQNPMAGTKHSLSQTTVSKKKKKKKKRSAGRKVYTGLFCTA